MSEKVYYIAETSIENKSAYSHHVIKMCDAFVQNGCEVNLLIPFEDKKIKFGNLKKKFLLIGKKPFLITYISNSKVSGFLGRVKFGYKTALYLKDKKKNLILTRSIISSFFLSIFKIKHYLELHSELKSFTKFLMINLGFINSRFIKKKILISQALNEIFKLKKNDFIVLHDGVDIKNFSKLKMTQKFKTATYVGSFYKGRGIEIIIELANRFSNIKFKLYGMKNESFKTKLNNVTFYNFADYNKVPKILQKSDILLMPYSTKVEVRAKNINTANYCSPLKMFDYLASGKIILSSKLNGICEVLKHKQNALIVDRHNIGAWSKMLEYAINNKYKLYTIQKNAFTTAKDYTWRKRAECLIKEEYK